MLRHELVRDVHVHAPDFAERAGEDDEQVEAARDLPSPQIAGCGGAPVVRGEARAGAADRPCRSDDLVRTDARLRLGILRRELRVHLFQRDDERVEGLRQIGTFCREVVAPVHPLADELAVVEVLLEEDPRHREQQRALGARIRRHPDVSLGGRIRQARIDADQRPAIRLRLDDPLRMRIEVVAGLEMRRQQQDRLCVRIVGRRPVRAAPEEVPQPSGR